MCDVQLRGRGTELTVQIENSGKTPLKIQQLDVYRTVFVSLAGLTPNKAVDGLTIGVPLKIPSTQVLDRRFSIRRCLDEYRPLRPGIYDVTAIYRIDNPLQSGFPNEARVTWKAFLW
ncbi:MAG: hypothetical protein ABL962_01330 [Fimbriimonadaceae bacterium]